LIDILFRETNRLKRVSAGLGLWGPDADDIIQQVYLKVRQEPDKTWTSEEATRWLIRVTTNECLMEHRRRKRFRLSVRQLLSRRPAPALPDGSAIHEEELQMVRQALQELDDSLIGPLALRYFSGLDSTEIGQILGLPPATVRSRLRDARLILARRLMQKGMEP
jgi:RNA polymerase sigma-70 factor, ECF subfamily